MFLKVFGVSVWKTICFYLVFVILGVEAAVDIPGHPWTPPGHPLNLPKQKNQNKLNVFKGVRCF